MNRLHADERVRPYRVHCPLHAEGGLVDETAGRDIELEQVVSRPAKGFLAVRRTRDAFHLAEGINGRLESER